MSGSDQSYRHTLECLRFESECRELAKNVACPDLQSHFLRLAEAWLALGVSRPDPHAGEGKSESGRQTV
jgi:hypothetical protein